MTVSLTHLSVYYTRVDLTEECRLAIIWLKAWRKMVDELPKDDPYRFILGDKMKMKSVTFEVLVANAWEAC